jgi:hypothetical protein
MGAEAEADVALGFLGLRKRDFRGNVRKPLFLSQLFEDALLLLLAWI